MHSVKNSIRAFVTIALLGGCASAAAGQSLGAVADKEEARRKRVAKSGKVYTNESLGRDQGTPPPQTSASASAAAPAKPPGEAPKSDAESDPRKSEAYWRERMTKARQGLERARTFQEALQSRINALTADFTARDDPAQRSVVANNRQKALAEQARVTAEIAAFEKEIRDIEEEARKAGVPPGWLR